MMVDLKFSFVEIVFILTFNFIHHCSGNVEKKLCVDILLETNIWVHEGNDIGLQNFKRSFRNLSMMKIDSDYAQETWKLALVKGYFKDLFKRHAIDTTKIVPQIDDWCEDKAKEYVKSQQTSTSRLQVDFERLKSIHYEDCYKCISSFFDLTKIGSMEFGSHIDFQTMYENWDIHFLQDVNEFGKCFKLGVVSDPKLPVVEHLRPYYLHVLNKVEELQPGNGSYRTMEEFCDDDGKQIVSNYN